MGLQVRDGSSDDIEPCVDLWTRIIVARDGASATEVTQQRARTAFSRPTVRFAAIGKDPVGFALTLNQDEHTALLSRLCVDPAATLQGLGVALVVDAVHHASEAGFSRIALDVRATNGRAIALYRRLGFTARSGSRDYDGGDPVLTLSRGLSQIE